MSKTQPKIIVFDNNALVSAFLNANSIPARAFVKAVEFAQLFISAETIEELETVIKRPKFDKYISRENREIFVQNFERVALKIHAPPLSMPTCRDPKDDKFLALALAAKAQFIVTGDADLLVLNPYQGIIIMKPAAFLELDLG